MRWAFAFTAVIALTVSMNAYYYGRISEQDKYRAAISQADLVTALQVAGVQYGNH